MTWLNRAWLPRHRPLVGTPTNSQIRHLREDCLKGGERHEDKNQTHAMKGGLFIFVPGWWEERRREGKAKKEKEEQRRGRVVEQDRARGEGEGESEDSCRQTQLFDFVWTRKVSKDE